MVIQPQYFDAWDFAEGLAPVRVSGDIGFIDTTGKVVIQPKYLTATPFSEAGCG